MSKHKESQNPTLSETQKNFIDYIQNDDNGIIKNLVHPPENIDIYKSSVEITQTEALNTIFNITSEYLIKNPHKLNLKYNLNNILEIFVKNIPCSYQDYFEYAQKFIMFLNEIQLKPDIPYLADLAKLDLTYSISILQKNNKLPNYSILENINNLDLNNIYITLPDYFEIIDLKYDILEFWAEFLINTSFKNHKIVKQQSLVFMTCYNHEIYHIEINEDILDFINIIKKTPNISVHNLLKKHENPQNFEKLFISSIEKKLVYLNP